MTIAGVRIDLRGSVAVNGLGANFHPFLSGSRDGDLTCEVFGQGADQTLLSDPRRPENPWSFQIRDGRCLVVRRHRDGDTLWRIVAPLSYDRFEVTWHPLLFPRIYVSYEYAWRASLGRLLLLLRLHRHGGLIVHGMAAELAGQGILCLGVSGAGKSTMARLLHEAGARVLSDERPVLRRWPPPAAARTAPGQPASFRVYGSPWPSSGGFVRNAWAPLRRLYLLEHGTEERLTPLAPRAAVTRLIQVAPMLWQEPSLMDPCLATIETLLASVPCAVLAFRPSAAAVRVIEDDLNR